MGKIETIDIGTIAEEKSTNKALDLFEEARKNYQYYLANNRMFIMCSDGTKLNISFSNFDLYKILGFNIKNIQGILYGYGTENDTLFFLEKLYHRDALEQVLSSDKLSMSKSKLIEKLESLSKTEGLNGDNIIGIIPFNRNLYYLTGNDIKNPSDYYLLVTDDDKKLFMLGIKEKYKEDNQKYCTVENITTSFDYNAMFYLQKVVLPTTINYTNYKGEIFDSRLHPVTIDKNMQNLISIAKFYNMYIDSGCYCCTLEKTLAEQISLNHQQKEQIAELTAKLDTQINNESQTIKSKILAKLFK